MQDLIILSAGLAIILLVIFKLIPIKTETTSSELQKLIEEANSNINFQIELKLVQSNKYLLHHFTDFNALEIYAAIYKGWLIGKGVYKKEYYD